RQQREDHHAEGLAAYVGNGIERDLPAMESSQVAAERRGPRMGGFVAGSGKQEHHVPHHARNQELSVHLVQPFTNTISHSTAIARSRSRRRSEPRPGYPLGSGGVSRYASELLEWHS